MIRSPQADHQGRAFDDAAALELRDIRKSFSDTEVLQSINLRVERGEFVTLLGPSGSGKTTTLNVIAGFIRPDSGGVFVNGVPVHSLPAHRRNIGVVFQNYALFPHMTVFDNIAFPLRQRKIGRVETREKVARALDLVLLHGHDSRYPRELSGGQQQRVALARALVFSPQILLMDEPLGALDKRLRDQMQVEIRRIHHDLAVTVVHVTHDQEEALALSDRIAVLSQGSLEQQGTPRDLYQHPQSIFVAEFLGEANCFTGNLTGSGEYVTVNGNGFEFRAPALIGDFPARGTLIVRPEHLRLTPAVGGCSTRSGPHAMNYIEATVDEIAYLGASTKIKLIYPDGSVGYARDDWDRISWIRRGEQVTVSWEADNGVIVPEKEMDAHA
ncbi:ABC transporter ATP-binding protein [Streptomyces sp. NBC_00233]|uniref:ABC transporter ATP-binding protein n=1 Tax=Streptomyces sp. NBC_00233 TaxID=2975686 RepID=UPI002257B0CA|nr:ABC transporter ATP-binding protein [Streptomyces sp. NBC_00233]MCX5233295.1 ABC transporter ATP-binding protein [Streptomyces sp. NBC_00233]